MRVALREVRRTIARHVVFPVVETLWAGTFSVAGAALRTRLRVLRPMGGDRVLVVAPHADDEALGCGLAIAAHVGAGDKVTVAVVTDGRRSRAGGLGPDAMRLQRQSEARRANRVLGTHLVLMDLPEGVSRPRDYEAAMGRILEQVRPTVVYAPSTVEFHPEHRRVALSLAKALKRTAVSILEVRVYEVQVPLTPALANSCVIGDDGTRRRKYCALECYVSQRASFRWLARRARYNALLYRTPRAVEVFACMSPVTYTKLVAAAARSRYRSIRPRPFSDPLAWLVGLRVRLHAASMAGIRVPRN